MSNEEKRISDLEQNLENEHLLLGRRLEEVENRVDRLGW